MPDNPFATEAAAITYARGRPDYSGVISPIIRRMLGLDEPVPLAVDIGSGTGISTMALAPLAVQVIGVEPSLSMLERAAAAPNVTYRRGSAEALPLENESCDLVSVGSALHWFDRQRFLGEASRVAKPEAWLVVHDHWFAGQMEGEARFEDWIKASYLQRYPPPERDRSWRPPADLGEWRHVRWERYDHSITFDAEHWPTTS